MIFKKIKYIWSFLYCTIALLNILGRVPKDIKKIKNIRNWLKETIGRSMGYVAIFRATLPEISKNNLAKMSKRIKEKLDDNKPKVLLVSHELSRTGAPKALLMMAKAVRDVYDCNPIVFSLKDGPMKDDFEKEGLSVFLPSDMPFMLNDLKVFLNQFDCIFVNSVSWEILNLAKEIDTPVLWWSHEIFTKKWVFEKINDCIDGIDMFLGGSPLTLDVMENKYKLDNSDLLLYGLDELQLPKTEKADCSIVFSIIGTVEERKGTDVFIDAIKNIPLSIRKNAKFKIIGDVGDGSEKYYQNMLKRAKGINEIEFLPSMSFDDLLKEYANSDVIVSTSRNDPMPIVLTYAFMFSKLCLSSNATGTSLLMDDMQTGVLFESGNSKGLSLKIIDIIENNKKYESIAQNGYKVYKNNFSQEQFKGKVKELLDKYIK